jgi:histone H3/H4
MLNLLPKQPPEPPAQHEALVILAKCRADLERCPDDKRGNWHEAATTAWAAMLQFERMVSQLIDLRSEVAGSTSHEAIDNAIEQLCETAGTLTEEAKRRAKDDAVNGAFYREIDNWNMRRGAAQ